MACLDSKCYCCRTSDSETDSSSSESSEAVRSSTLSRLGSLAGLISAIEEAKISQCRGSFTRRFIGYSLVLLSSSLFVVFLGPGFRGSSEGVYVVPPAAFLRDRGTCHREPWLFYIPTIAGSFAAVAAVNIFLTAGSWHFWIAGIFLQGSCFYGWCTALDECLLALREGFVEKDGLAYLVCPLGYVELPGLDHWIVQNFEILTSKVTSLALRMSVQLALALWVEATVLYRLKCLKALSGNRRSTICTQLTVLWWIQILLLPCVLIPDIGLAGHLRKILCLGFVAFFLLGSATIFRMLNLILRRLWTYMEVARAQDSEEARQALASGRDRVRRQCWGYLAHVTFTVCVGTFIVVANDEAFHESDAQMEHLQPAPVLLKLSFIAPALHIVVLVGGPFIMANANAAVSQQSEFCVWRRKRHRTHRMEAEWHEKVVDLSERGITAKDLLDFYQRLGKDLMPHYDPQVHTTRDVVRLGIIPATRRSGQALAVEMAQGKPVKVRNMVTHSWENLFRDLVAAVLADAMEENTFDMIAHSLQQDPSICEEMLQDMDAFNVTYWICAFCVNQHTSICNINPARNVDSMTKRLYPLCDCDVPKYLNNTPPLDRQGRSILCELNKFDYMMEIIAERDVNFAQVLAIDQDFSLFHRAWCIAELAEARLLSMPQHVKVCSRAVLAEHMEGLRDLRVQDLRATRPEDVEEILSKIQDFETFNQGLQQLIFDPQLGILANWRELDAARQMEEVGRLLRWGRADGGRGVVWSNW